MYLLEVHGQMKLKERVCCIPILDSVRSLLCGHAYIT